jgi:hypothetical protein
LQDYYLKNGPKLSWVFQKSDLETSFDHRLWPKNDHNRPGVFQIADAEMKLKLQDSNPSISVSVTPLSSRGSELKGSSSSLLNKVSDSKIFRELAAPLSLRKHDSSKSPRSIVRSPSGDGITGSKGSPLSNSSGSIDVPEAISLLSPTLVSSQGIFKSIVQTLPMTHEALIEAPKRLLIESLRYVRTRIAHSNVDDETKRALYEWIIYIPFVRTFHL